MDLLLDTHAIIWLLSANNSLSKKVKIAIEDSSNLKIISIVSIWEMAIKSSITCSCLSRFFSGNLIRKP